MSDNDNLKCKCGHKLYQHSVLASACAFITECGCHSFERDEDNPRPVLSSYSKPVTQRVRDILDERESTGIERYGQSLHSFNGRNVQLDLVSELIDAVQYGVQFLMEREEVEKEINSLKNILDSLESQEEASRLELGYHYINVDNIYYNKIDKLIFAINILLWSIGKGTKPVV